MENAGRIDTVLDSGRRGGAGSNPLCSAVIVILFLGDTTDEGRRMMSEEEIKQF